MPREPASASPPKGAADLQQRWNQGCTDAALLHAEIAAHGYQGQQATGAALPAASACHAYRSGAPAAPADRPEKSPGGSPATPATSPSGIAEGTICRVKALKRQMSGRANVYLLRKRILLST
jgi:hypothetical protein